MSSVMIAEDHAIDAPPVVGRDERRMHVRAYNMWAAMLRGRRLPDIADLDPARAGDFFGNGVLLDLRGAAGDPAIIWLGEALRAEGEIAGDARRIGQVPAHALLAQVRDHIPPVVANAAPIGFEAEFVNVRGNTALYRGILMPFSSDGVTIDHVYGVVNWKEVVDAETAAQIVAAARAAMMPVPAAAPLAPVWADGPSRTQAAAAGSPAALADLLPLLHEAGRQHRLAERRARDALHRALGAAYDLAFTAEEDATGYAALLDQAGIPAQPGSPWQPIVKLVLGDELPRTLVARYAAVLAHAWRHDVAPGELGRFLESRADGLRGIVADERACRIAERG